MNHIEKRQTKKYTTASKAFFVILATAILILAGFLLFISQYDNEEENSSINCLRLAPAIRTAKLATDGGLDVAKLSDEALSGLWKVTRTKGSEVSLTLVNRLKNVMRFSDDVIDASLRGVERGIIEADDEMVVRLGKLEGLARKAGWTKGAIDEPGRYGVRKMFDAPGVKTHVVDKNIKYFGKLDDVAVFRYGDDTWGYRHIFEYVERPGVKTRAEQIMDVFPELKTKEDIFTRVKEVIKTGEKIDNKFVAKFWSTSENAFYYFEVTMGKDPDKIGSVITLVPRGVV